MLQSLQGLVSPPAFLLPPFMFQTLIWSSNTTLKLVHLPVTRPMASFLISPPSFHWFGDTLRVCSRQPTVSQPNLVWTGNWAERHLTNPAIESKLAQQVAASAATVSVASAHFSQCVSSLHLLRCVKELKFGLGSHLLPLLDRERFGQRGNACLYDSCVTMQRSKLALPAPLKHGSYPPGWTLASLLDPPLWLPAGGHTTNDFTGCSL